MRFYIFIILTFFCFEVKSQHKIAAAAANHTGENYFFSYIIGNNFSSPFFYINNNTPKTKPNNSHFEEYSFEISPNPASDFIRVVSSTENNFDLLIYNSQGSRVLIQKNCLPNSIINISSLQSGIYFLIISSEKNKSFIKKISVCR